MGFLDVMTNFMGESCLPESILLLTTFIGFVLIFAYWFLIMRNTGIGVYVPDVAGSGIIMQLILICLLGSIATVIPRIIGRVNLLMFVPGAGFKLEIINIVILAWVFMGAMLYLIFFVSWVKHRLGSYSDIYRN